MARPGQMKGNQNARKGLHQSIVVRIPVAFVDAIYKSMEKEGFEWKVENGDLSDYTLTLIQRQLEANGCPPGIRVYLGDE